MKPKLLLRLAAFCTLFFLVGHSIGHFTRKDVTEPQAQAVLKLMAEYKFTIGTQLRTYDEFYTGMSLNLIITLAMLTAFLWILSSLAHKQPETCARFLGPILFCFVGFTVTSFVFFFIVPSVTCLVASILIALAMYQLQNKRQVALVNN